MFNSQSQNLSFDEFVSQPGELSQYQFTDFTLPSQTQASQLDNLSQVILKIFSRKNQHLSMTHVLGPIPKLRNSLDCLLMLLSTR